MSDPTTPTGDAAALLPCHHCGSKDVRAGTDDYDDVAYVLCIDCEARGPAVRIEYGNDDDEDDQAEDSAKRDAIAAWNRRAAPPQPDAALREALGTVLEHLSGRPGVTLGDLSHARQLLAATIARLEEGEWQAKRAALAAAPAAPCDHCNGTGEIALDRSVGAVMDCPKCRPEPTAAAPTAVGAQDARLAIADCLCAISGATCWGSDGEPRTLVAWVNRLLDERRNGEEPCRWTYDETDGAWRTGCTPQRLLCWEGGEHPTEHGARFCQCCGRPLRIGETPAPPAAAHPAPPPAGPAVTEEWGQPSKHPCDKCGQMAVRYRTGHLSHETDTEVRCTACGWRKCYDGEDG